MPDVAVVVLIGQAMLLASAVLVVFALLAVLPAALRVRRRALALRATVLSVQHMGVTAIAELRAQRAETEALLAPWRRLLRWARHPLVVATVDWYVRRRRRPRRRG